MPEYYVQGTIPLPNCDPVLTREFSPNKCTPTLLYVSGKKPQLSKFLLKLV